MCYKQSKLDVRVTKILVGDQSSIDWLIEQGLMPTKHVIGHIGRQVFTGQMTQPTVSKQWPKIGPKDKASIPSGPPHRAHNNTTTMQYETKTQNTHR